MVLTGEVDVDRLEEVRLEAVHGLGVLDTPEEPRFDRIVELARRIFGVPFAAVNLIDADRQWTKARSGLPVPRELPRDESLCSTAIEGSEALLVRDARQDARFAALPVIAAPGGMRFYAGQPLVVNGERVGALCLTDVSPRELSTDQVELLGELGRWVELELSRTDEMHQAAEVQRRLLPATAPDVPGLQVSGTCLQSSAVGGDFFDWFETEDGLQVVLADVMGKGLGAALLAATVRATLRTAGRLGTLEETMRTAATSIAADLDASGAFVTAFIARVDPQDGRVRYVDAGHGLGIVLDTAGGLRRLADDQPPLGLPLDHEWTVREAVLEPGDTLVAVSDGFLDFFTSEADAVRAAIEVGSRAASAAELVEDFLQYARHRIPRDDVSVLAVRRTA